MLRQNCLERNPRLEEFFSKKSKNVMIKRQDVLKTLPLDVRKSPMSFVVPSGCKDTLELPLLPEKNAKNSKKVVEIYEGCL